MKQLSGFGRASQLAFAGGFLLAIGGLVTPALASDVACSTAGAEQTLVAGGTNTVIGTGNGCTAVDSNFQNFNVSSGSGSFPAVTNGGAAAIEFPTASIVSGQLYTLDFTTTGQNTQDQNGTKCVASSWCGTEGTAATTTQTISYYTQGTNGSNYYGITLSDGTFQDSNPLVAGDTITLQENFCLGATSTTVGSGGCTQAQSGYLLVTLAVGGVAGPLSGTVQICTPGATGCTLGTASAGTSVGFNFAAVNEIAVSDTLTIVTNTGGQTIFLDSFDNTFDEAPEPSTFILMGSALAGVVALRFRRRAV